MRRKGLFLDDTTGLIKNTGLLALVILHFYNVSLMGRRNRTEEIFAKAAEDAGFIVGNPQPIRAPEPITGKNGKKKEVTLPDYYVIDPITGKGVHVEITNGRGLTDHKHNQMMVVAAAGVTNYAQVTGREIEEVSNAGNIRKRALLLVIFGWLAAI
jgi:hypothetical protein